MGGGNKAVLGGACEMRSGMHQEKRGWVGGGQEACGEQGGVRRRARTRGRNQLEEAERGSAEQKEESSLHQCHPAQRQGEPRVRVGEE